MKDKMIGLFFWMSNAFVTVLGLSLQMETISDILRDPNGDFFTVKSNDCHTRGCAKNGRLAETVKASNDMCRCQCSESHPVIRDDRKECIKQLECSLVNFIRPLLTEHIPVVGLPVSSGQLIHPGAHLILAGDDKSINHSKQMLCQIDGSDVMTPKGWQPIQLNDGSHAFELYEDGNHTFLQWLANDSVRKSLHQKLVLIHLYCSPVESSPRIFVFKPCIAIRIGWVPGLGVISDRESSDQNKAFSAQNTNYSMIGLCLGLLGVMYVSALMVYMRSKHTEDIKYDERQITHRWPSDSEESQATTNRRTTSITRNTPTDLRSNIGESSAEYDSINLDIESDMRSTPTDWTHTLPSIDYNTSEETENNLDVTQNGNALNDSTDLQSCANQSPIYEKRLQKPDRIPRHCLRISPELFEPRLLLDPPPTAVEMLNKIRDLISMAKMRLRNFRYRPTLVVIPEDDYFYNENKSVVSTDVINAEMGLLLQNESTVCFGANQHIIEINDENHSIISTDINRKVLRETDLDNSLTEEPNNETILSDNGNELQFKSFSRKQMLNNLQLSNTQNINDLNFNQESNISDQLIEVQNLELESEGLDANNIYSDIHTLEVISTKVEKDLHKKFEKQIFSERQVNETSDKTMFSYFRNSLGRFGSKSKSKSDQVLVSSNNWTLQSASAARKTRLRTMAQKSVIRKRMTSRRGQLCYNCSDVSSLSSQRLSNAYNDFEQKPSLESNENNESMDSFDCCTYSDSEMSTTSSTIRDNQLTSLESELNDSSHSQIVDNHTEEHSSIDECLKYLAAALVDDNHDKYYQRIGRASKGMSAIKQLNYNEWNHVCHRSDSELELSQKKCDFKTSFYSKNSKSRIKSSKSLNSNNRQKFKKKLALYKSQTNGVLNTNDNQSSSQISCKTATDQCLNGLTDNFVNNIRSNFDSNSFNIPMIKRFENRAINCEQNEDLSEHFVVKIKI